MNLKPSFIIAGLCALLVSTPVQAAVTYNKKEILSKGCCTWITHAAGSMGGNNYLNSREGLMRHLELGERLIEVDFMPTSDGVWVGVRQWSDWRRRHYKNQKGNVLQQARDALMGERAPDFAEFQASRIYGAPDSGTGDVAYTPLTIADLEKAALMYPDLRIITDTKDQVTRLYETLQKTALKDRLIYQVYDVAEMDFMQKQGHRFIVTLYKIAADGSITCIPDMVEEILERRNSIIAVTLPLKKAASDNYALLKRVHDAGFPVLVNSVPKHINAPEQHETLADMGANGLYLD